MVKAVHPIPPMEKNNNEKLPGKGQWHFCCCLATDSDTGKFYTGLASHQFTSTIQRETRNLLPENQYSDLFFKKKHTHNFKVDIY